MSSKNYNYGKYNATSKSIDYAPKALQIDYALVLNPSKEIYLKYGWKEIIKNPPTTGNGYHYEENEWKENLDTIEMTYNIVKDEVVKTIRIFSKLKFVAIMTKLKKWNEIRNWIIQNDLMDLYMAAQDFREDNEYFIQGKKAIQDTLKMSDEEVEKILSQCIAED